jgi:hypothetical protein
MSFGVDVFSGWRPEEVHLRFDLALDASAATVTLCPKRPSDLYSLPHLDQTCCT